MSPKPPNHALQRTRPSRHCCNRSVSWAGSLSLGRFPAMDDPELTKAVVMAAWSANNIWTFSRVGWEEFYRAAGYSPQQIDMAMRFGGTYATGMVWMIVFMAVAVFSCLLYVRRYFV